MSYNDDLLRPSLQEDTFNPIYSSTALMAAAFLGGGFAVVGIAALNAQRLNRLAKDWIWLVGGVLLTAVALYLAIHLLGTLRGEPDASRNVRLVGRGIGFALWGIFYFLHRQQYRAMASFGTEPPSPYVPVILAVVIAIGCSLLLASLALTFPMSSLV